MAFSFSRPSSTPWRNKMNDSSYDLHPKVKVSELDIPDLTLCNFHIVLVAEPDPETWMITTDDEEQFHETLEIISDLILNEVFGNGELPDLKVELAKDVEEPRLVTVGECEIPWFFPRLEWISRARFGFSDFEFKDLGFYLQGIANQYPTWRVAVVGAVIHDEVTRIANVAQKAGLDTTIVTRYCFTSQSLVNLDELFASIPPFTTGHF
jgi:5,10-methenyltetrahydromethanopterin hydrogenase